MTSFNRNRGRPWPPGSTAKCSWVADTMVVHSSSVQVIAHSNLSQVRPLHIHVSIGRSVILGKSLLPINPY